jgi:hypothetical protein
MRNTSPGLAEDRVRRLWIAQLGTTCRAGAAPSRGLSIEPVRDVYARCIISLATTKLSDELRHQLTVVRGYIGPCDEHAARKAIHAVARCPVC